MLSSFKQGKDKNLHLKLSHNNEIAHICFVLQLCSLPGWNYSDSRNNENNVGYITSLLRVGHVGPLIQLGYEYAALLVRLRPCSTTIVGLCAYGWLWYCQDKQIRSFHLCSCWKVFTVFQREHWYCGIVLCSFVQIASRALGYTNIQQLLLTY